MFCNKNKLNWDDFDGLRETVKSLVKERRYIHTLGVEEEAINLAKIFECDEIFAKKLKSAAILHDITKEFDFKKQLEICKEYNITLSKDDKKTVKAIHAKTGAYVAKIEFNADDMIFGGIYNHTFGDPSENFKLFDKIIYLADYIEPSRTFEDCVEVREFFYSRIKDFLNPEEKNKIIDETILFSYNKTIESLIKENAYMHKDTIKCRNALINKKIIV